jgi:NAD(P)-dependent dehydrogenase (short-subunit alcohol dehydrogenase family)
MAGPYPWFYGQYPILGKQFPFIRIASMTYPSRLPRAALVTGAGRRIGNTIARHLAEAGFALALHARHSVSEAEATAQAIRAAGGHAVVVQGDLGAANAPEKIMADAREALGTVGVLVNNASLFEPDSAGRLDVGLWEQHFAVNLRAPVFLAQAFAAQLPQPGEGVVVNMIDQRILKLTPQFMSYTLSKAALHTATVTLAQALAPRIRVVGIGPGPTLANSRQDEDDFLAQQAALPLQRGPSPEDVARAVMFMLATPSITGQMLAVDGGQHITWQTPDVSNIRE